jgi:hypothetical protein
VQPTQSGVGQIGWASRPRILVDTNVWRYLIDLDGLETVYRAAKGAHGLILACPAVLYEMLRLEDASLRRQLIKAICRSRWLRMMPEAFEESAELKEEIVRLRPSWLLREPDRSSSRRLYNDWNGPSGVWRRARVDPTEASAILKLVEGDHIRRGRDDARELRTEIGKITTFDTVTLDGWTTIFSPKPDGWDGNPVETWRAATMQYYIDALLKRDTAQSSAPREWLQPWIDFDVMQKNLPSLISLFLYETDASRLPRNWLRWALQTLQGTRKTSPGTPVDNQIGSYLLDADLFVTADKVFVSIVQRVANEAVVQIATPVLVSVDNCVTTLIKHLRQEPPMPLSPFA